MVLETQVQEQRETSVRLVQQLSGLQQQPQGMAQVAERIVDSLREFGVASSSSRRADLARLGKPEPFTPPGNWHEWEFGFIAWIATMDAEMADRITSSKIHNTPLEELEQGSPEDQSSKSLYYVLSQLTRKAARK